MHGEITETSVTIKDLKDARVLLSYIQQIQWFLQDNHIVV